MKKIIFVLLFASPIIFLSAQQNSGYIIKRVISSIDSTYENELVLIQKFDINVSLDSVWNAYTTKNGWEAAFVPLAEVNFRIGGTIKTSYNADATIGDSSTIVLHIINYVPQKLITLQAELSSHFPDFMKEDEKNLYNLVYFEAVGTSVTRVTSYGIGYRNNEKYRALMKFFISGNEMSYMNLIKYLETGKPIKH